MFGPRARNLLWQLHTLDTDRRCSALPSSKSKFAIPAALIAAALVLGSIAGLFSASNDDRRRRIASASFRGAHQGSAIPPLVPENCLFAYRAKSWNLWGNTEGPIDGASVGIDLRFPPPYLGPFAWPGGPGAGRATIIDNPEARGGVLTVLDFRRRIRPLPR